jgi:GAF domain-containing protein
MPIGSSGVIGAVGRESGFRSTVGAPVLVEGHLWGLIAIGSTNRDLPVPAGTEARLGQFTELLATAISNAESRSGLARPADEHAALRRVATLVGRGAPPEELGPHQRRLDRGGAATGGHRGAACLVH